MIKLIVVKPEHLTASYKNDGKKDVIPKYMVKIYNRYGYLLGSDRVGGSLFGGSSLLEPGDVGGEKIRMEMVDITAIFKHTKLELPDDFFSPAWVSLSASNTKLTSPEGGDPAAPATGSGPGGN